MARKVILDVDPGIDGALAVALALADPRMDVVAVTSTAGCISPELATRNVQTIIEQLDPSRWPRIGAAATDWRPRIDARHLNGQNGLGEAAFNVAELHHLHPSDKVLHEEIHAAPGDITLIALGPLTNVAAVLHRDPDLASLVGHLIVLGGTWIGPGDVTAAAEFNMLCNPGAARTVFRGRWTLTVVPVDVSSQVVMTYDHADQLPSPETRTGAFLRAILPYAYRAHRQHFGMEGIHVHDAVAVVAALHPELFETQRAHGDVETTGDLCRGVTVFDRRPVPEHQPNMDVVVNLDAVAVMDALLRTLAQAS